MAGFAKFLGVEGAADAEGEAAVDLGVVGKAGNAAVVDLGLIDIVSHSSIQVL